MRLATSGVLNHLFATRFQAIIPSTKLVCYSFFSFQLFKRLGFFGSLIFLISFAEVGTTCLAIDTFLVRFGGDPHSAARQRHLASMPGEVAGHISALSSADITSDSNPTADEISHDMTRGNQQRRQSGEKRTTTPRHRSWIPGRGRGDGRGRTRGSGQRVSNPARTDTGRLLGG